MSLALLAIILLALAFDFINGFHDAANSIATVVSTRVLSPRIAVLWAAFFNFVAFLIFETKVASNISKGIDPAVATLTIVAAGLVGAIVWDLLTWWWGLPTSSSHALLGGLAGAAVVKAGFGALDGPFFLKTAAFIVISPAVGLLLAVGVMQALITFLGSKAPGRLERVFRKLQLLSAASYSLGHGGNDAQKTMGIIVAALAAQGVFQHTPGHNEIPLWVVLTCHAAMGLGTMSGGWRIVRTMGMRITKLTPIEGFCAETSGAASLFMATALGIPVSTTHTITGAIVGTGSVRKFSAVRWGVAGRIVWAWVLTIPGSAAIGAVTYLAARAFGIPG
jgi:inorganic phosphate transporter, PiT family